MIERIRRNEPLEVLVFIVAPLVLLLIVGLNLRVWLKRPTQVVFPNFTLAISYIDREQARISYRDNDRDLVFYVEVTGGRQIDACVPEEWTAEDVASIVPNLALGFQKLRFEYLIYRTRSGETVSEQERKTAIADLRRMGFEVKTSGQRMEIKSAEVPPERGASRAKAKKTKTATLDLLRLFAQARGVRASIEILARSDSAIDRVGNVEGRQIGS